MTILRQIKTLQKTLHSQRVAKVFSFSPKKRYTFTQNEFVDFEVYYLFVNKMHTFCKGKVCHIQGIMGSGGGMKCPTPYRSSLLNVKGTAKGNGWGLRPQRGAKPIFMFTRDALTFHMSITYAMNTSMVNSICCNYTGIIQGLVILGILVPSLAY